jgi:hypothetical protein
LPLLDSEAHTTILSTTFKTVLKQTFFKSFSSKNDAECMYQFPLYDSVSVVEFKCRIGTKPALFCLVKGNAQAISDATVNDNVGLLIQAPESPDVFTTRIGNAQVGESIFVEVTYIGELNHDDDMVIRFTIPTTIAPPGHEAPLAVSEFAGVPIPPLAPHRIRITVDVILPAGKHVKEVESPSHLIAVSTGTISVTPQAALVLNKASTTLSL